MKGTQLTFEADYRFRLLLFVENDLTQISPTQAGPDTHPNAKPNTNCSSELQTMNNEKSLFARYRVEYCFGTLVNRTIREQRREERRLAEQRATKHHFQARDSCILDGRNYRIARGLLLLARAQF